MIKPHLLADHDGLIPDYAMIIARRTSDIAVASQMEPPKRRMMFVDRGYRDHRWFAVLAVGQGHLVTR